MVGSPRPSVLQRALRSKGDHLNKAVGYVVKYTDTDVVKIIAVNRKLPKFISRVQFFSWAV